MSHTLTHAGDSLYGAIRIDVEQAVAAIPDSLYGMRARLRWALHAIEDYRRARGQRHSAVRVLDVGCGTGEYLTAPLARFGYRVTGIDSDPASLAHAHTIAPTATFHDAADFWARPPELVDVVICSEMLEHVTDPGAVLRQLATCTTTGGLLLITVPNGRGPFEAERALWDWLQLDRVAASHGRANHGSSVRDTLDPVNTHVQFYSRSQIRTLIEAAGFRVTAMRGRTVLCGPFSDRTLGRIARVVPPVYALNAWAARWLPTALTSGWMIRATRH